MRAVVFRDGELVLTDRPKPEPQAGEALVRVGLAGVCNTDLEIVRGYLGFEGVLGHEFVGEVVGGEASWRGRRVVGEINFGCGQCRACARGMERHCPERRVLGIAGADGALAEYTVLPVRNLHAVPDQVPDDAAVFAEPLAAAFEILEQVVVTERTDTLVLGDGKLGLLVALVLARARARVRVVGKHAAHLELVRQHGIDAVELDAWDRGPADLVVEVTGRAGGLELAIAATRPRGTLVLKSTVAEPVTADLAPLVIDEITLVGSRCGRFEPALAALADGSIDPRPLIEERFPLEQALAALERAAEPGTLKVLLHPTVGS